MRYARAFTALVDDKNLPSALTQLNAAQNIICGARAFYNPVVPAEKKQEVINEIFKDNKVYVRNLLLLLAENKKLRLLPQITKDVQDIADKRTGTLRAEIFYANTPDAAEQKKIETALKKRFEVKTVAAEYKEDKQLLGGVKIKTQDIVIDGSVKKSLEKLQALLEV